MKFWIVCEKIVKTQNKCFEILQLRIQKKVNYENSRIRSRSRDETRICSNFEVCFVCGNTHLSAHKTQTRELNKQRAHIRISISMAAAAEAASERDMLLRYAEV
jgi:hypothetical protein